jgi:hypothetical protein
MPFASNTLNEGAIGLTTRTVPRNPMMRIGWTRHSGRLDSRVPDYRCVAVRPVPSLTGTLERA